MKVYELIKALNTKMSVKYANVLDVKKYYLSLYRAYMVMLYDKGYVSDPTVFDVKELYRNIVDMDIRMTGIAGKIELSEDYIGLALARYKNDEEISEFLELLLNAVKYRRISMNLDKFHDDSGILNSSKKKISLGLVQAASNIKIKSGYELDEGVLKCFNGITEEYDFVSLDDVIYTRALKELELDGVETDKGLFVKGITREEEIKYSNLILNGMVKLDGEYASKLLAWLKKTKWAENNRFSAQNEGLYNWALYVKSNDTIEEQSMLMNSLLDEGKEIAGMKANGFFIKSNRETIKMPIGVFAVASEYESGEDKILPDINRLEGYTGEGYSLSFLTKSGISYVGCPIEVYVAKSEKSKNYTKMLFVDKEQTDMKGSISWFKYMEGKVNIVEDFDAKRLEGLAGKLQEALINAERGHLISEFDLKDYLDIDYDVKKLVVSETL